mmetsp:Transcript_57487/g.182081  ORF Transcript_57487/g.182081 Transcript_57487/m.182081 type:complete len:389 (+) Transcript_57487:79-1245(+)
MLCYLVHWDDRARVRPHLPGKHPAARAHSAALPARRRGGADSDGVGVGNKLPPHRHGGFDAELARDAPHAALHVPGGAPALVARFKSSLRGALDASQCESLGGLVVAPRIHVGAQLDALTRGRGTRVHVHAPGVSRARVRPHRAGARPAHRAPPVAGGAGRGGVAAPVRLLARVARWEAAARPGPPHASGARAALESRARVRASGERVAWPRELRAFIGVGAPLGPHPVPLLAGRARAREPPPEERRARRRLVARPLRARVGRRARLPVPHRPWRAAATEATAQGGGLVRALHPRVAGRPHASIHLLACLPVPLHPQGACAARVCPVGWAVERGGSVCAGDGGDPEIQKSRETRPPLAPVHVAARRVACARRGGVAAGARPAPPAGRA